MGLHLSKAAGTIDDAMTAFAAFWTKIWDGNGGTVVGLSGYFNAHTVAESLVVTALDPLTGKNVEQLQASVNHHGIGVDFSLPGEVAVCVSFRTALPTRAGRGRCYLPNPTIDVMSDGLYDHTFILDTVTAMQYGLQSLSTAGYPAVIYHAGPKTFTPITSVDVGDVPDSQRRRRNKLVENRQSLPV